MIETTESRALMHYRQASSACGLNNPLAQAEALSGILALLLSDRGFHRIERETPNGDNEN